MNEKEVRQFLLKVNLQLREEQDKEIEIRLNNIKYEINSFLDFLEKKKNI